MRIVVVFLLTAGFGFNAHADTLRVMTYNALNFRGNQDMDRSDDFRKVIGWVQPDVICMQEIWSQDAIDLLLSFSFLPVADDYATVPFIDGEDTDNAFFYRTSRVQFISQRVIVTELRNIGEYIFRPLELDSTARIRLYSAHLKASQGADNEQRRRDEAAILRGQLNLLPAGSLYMVMGDFNLYTSDEPAYQLMLDAEPNPNGQLFDPIDSPGDWNNSASFAAIHTQSPRVESFGGGSTGGLDDRFDFILASAGFMDTVGCYVIPSSYKPVGNDGLHFNQSINAGFNYAVPDSVADALYYAADHLPVQVDVVIREEPTSVFDSAPLANSVLLVSCFPNPFNPVLNVSLSPLRTLSHLQIFDALGRSVESRFVNGGAGTLQFDFSQRAAGTYFVSVNSGAQHTIQKVILLK